MTDKNKKDAEKSAAGTQEPETSADDNQGPATAEFQTVEDLEACYPQLVSEIRDEVIEQVGKCSAKKMKENMPELYERIVAELQSKGGPNLNVPGFLLEIDDPVAAGTLRSYQKSKGIDNLRLPYVLPYKDKKKTKAALENYILRADGCGDRKRADAGREAMKKIK